MKRLPVYANALGGGIYAMEIVVISKNFEELLVFLLVVFDPS
jgi:hypothetical protein